MAVLEQMFVVELDLLCILMHMLKDAEPASEFFVVGSVIDKGGFLP